VSLSGGVHCWISWYLALSVSSSYLFFFFLVLVLRLSRGAEGIYVNLLCSSGAFLAGDGSEAAHRERHGKRDRRECAGIERTAAPLLRWINMVMQSHTRKVETG